MAQVVLKNVPQTILLQMPLEACGHCGAFSGRYKCGRCQSVCYCSQECQKRAWISHKINCVAAATGTKFEMQKTQGTWVGEGITSESTANQPPGVVNADLLPDQPTEPLNEMAKFEFGGNASDVTLEVCYGRHYATMPDG